MNATTAAVPSATPTSVQQLKCAFATSVHLEIMQVHNPFPDVPDVGCWVPQLVRTGLTMVREVYYLWWSGD